MSVAAIKLTEPARKKIFKLLIILNIIQLILGICSLVIGLYFYITIARHLHKSNRFYSSITVLYILSVGLMAVMLSIFGIKMSYNCSSKPFMKNMNSFHNSWIAFNIVSLILMISFLFAINKLFNLLLHLITDTFWHGISHYISDIAWKNTFDYFQNSFKCCGINTYSDWYVTPWIPLSFLPQDANTLSRFGRADGQVLFPILPSSCCRKNIMGSKCRIDVLEKLTTYIQPVPISEIYITGCIPLISRSLTIILTSLMLISILITIVETSVVVSGHYLYTSTRNSLLMGIPNDAAPGWLFGRGDFGYHGGKTLFDDNLEVQLMDENVEHATELKEKKTYRGLDMIEKKLQNTSRKKYKVKHQLDSAVSPVKERLRRKLAKFKLHKKKKFNTESKHVTETKKSEGEKNKLDKQKELSNNLEINEQNNSKSKQNKINKKKGLHHLEKDQQKICPSHLNDEKCNPLNHKINCNSDTGNNLNKISNHRKTYETNYNLSKNSVKSDDLSDILHNLGVS